MKRLEKIVLVELNPQLPNLGSQLILPRHGALAVGSKLKEAGYDVIYLYEGIMGKITPELIMEYKPDIVAFTAITAAIPKVEVVARELSKNGLEIILGGEHASMMTEFIDFADYIVINEGEHVAVQLLDALNNNGNLSKIPNLRCKLDANYKQNKLIQPEQIPIDFRYDLSIVEKLSSIKFFKKKLLRLPLQTSRGCPYSCKFCVTKDLLGKRYRRRAVEDILADIESGLEYGIKSFRIVDNNFGIGEKETVKLLERIIAEDYGVRFTALVRTGIGKNEKVVELMKKVGIDKAAIGIESINDQTLLELNKNQKISQVIDTLNIFHDNGISSVGLFVVGADNDSVDSVRRIPEFALKYKIDKIQITPLTNIPNPFYRKEQMFPNYRSIPDIPFKYYNGHFVTLYPKRIRPSVLQEEIDKMYRDFYSVSNILKSFTYTGRRLNAFRGRVGIGFVMNLRVNNSIRRENYLEFLRKKEASFYEGNNLDESKLKENI